MRSICTPWVTTTDPGARSASTSTASLLRWTMRTGTCFARPSTPTQTNAPSAFHWIASGSTAAKVSPGKRIAIEKAMPARSRSSVLSRLARTRSVRVSASIRLSTVTTSPIKVEVGAAQAAGPRPARPPSPCPTNRSGTRKSTRMCDRSSSVVTSVALVTWSPTSTPRMPTHPSNGARMARCSTASSASRTASSAWARASCAVRSWLSLTACERTSASSRASVARASSSVRRARSSCDLLGFRHPAGPAAHRSPRSRPRRPRSPPPGPKRTASPKPTAPPARRRSPKRHR